MPLSTSQTAAASAQSLYVETISALLKTVGPVVALVLCAESLAQTNRFRDHNYASVEECVRIRTERTAYIKESSSKGLGWTLKENLERALVEQDPAKCPESMPEEVKRRQAERQQRWDLAKPPVTVGTELIFATQQDCAAYYEKQGHTADWGPSRTEQTIRDNCTPEAFAASQDRVKTYQAAEEKRRIQEKLAGDKRKLEQAERAKQVKACVERNALRKVGTVKLGMTSEDVQLCGWGRPESVNRSVGSWGVNEQWVYGTRNYLYFENGTLKSWQN